jgi:plastocyanin
MMLAKAAAAGLAVLVLGFGLTAWASRADEERRIEITKSGFAPQTLELKAGEKVAWTNTDEKEHSVTANEKIPGDAQDRPMFDSGILKPGATWEFTFRKPGTYAYHCVKDATMTGSVTVR